MEVETLFLSDCHLGYKSANDEAILDILKNTKFNRLILIGDIIDFKRLKKNLYWNETHNKIIQKILKYSRDREVVYVWGNHDKLDIFGERLGNILICREYVHVLKNGRSLLCVHGDLFEKREKRQQRIERIGGIIYDFFSEIDFILGTNFVKWGKKKLKNVKNYVAIFEEDGQKYAESKGFDAIICGHIHCPKIKDENSEFLYCNTGDFVHNCSYIVETLDGKLKLIKR